MNFHQFMQKPKTGGQNFRNKPPILISGNLGGGD